MNIWTFLFGKFTFGRTALCLLCLTLFIAFMFVSGNNAQQRTIVPYLFKRSRFNPFLFKRKRSMVSLTELIHLFFLFLTFADKEPLLRLSDVMASNEPNTFDPAQPDDFYYYY